MKTKDKIDTKIYRVIGYDMLNTYRYNVNTSIEANSFEEALAKALNKNLSDIVFKEDTENKYYPTLWRYEVEEWEDCGKKYFQIEGDKTTVKNL